MPRPSLRPRVALVRLLLRDGGSPLYAPSEPWQLEKKYIARALPYCSIELADREQLTQAPVPWKAGRRAAAPGSGVQFGPEIVPLRLLE